MRRLEALLDRIGLALLEWWAWPLGLVLLALALLAGGLALEPGPGDAVTILGRPALPPCPSLEATGVPCGQCGTTRSWVWAARGHLALAARYNPAAFAAWVWVMAGGLVGAARLVRRDPALVRLSWPLLAAAVVAWVLLYALAWQARLRGWNPLP